MIGTIVNTVAIIVGSLLGLLLKGGIKEKYSHTVMQAVGLAVIMIGLQGALKAKAILVVIFSLAIGSIIGEWLDIEIRLERTGKWLEKRFTTQDGDFAKGFISSTLMFCVGSMAIVGSLESGLNNNHQILFAKSVLDGIAAVVFASTFGVGVLFSAFAVFLYQGSIALTASLLKVILVDTAVTQMSAVGGLLIMAIGINILELKCIKVGNMLPAIFIPLVYQVLISII
jgi:uncharacterized membrane protein YqgA involved in biofilm formation